MQTIYSTTQSMAARTTAAVMLLTAATFAPQAASAAEATASTPAYRDTSLSFKQRAADLVSRMTLKEKVGQMQNDAPAIPRLGVPAYDWWNEALHGVARAGYATIFPQAIGMAATFDPKLLHHEATVISDEARAKYNYSRRHDIYARYTGLTFWSPNINIFRDPRWGRGQETYGEDPYLMSRMGVAFIRGLQGNNPKYRKLDATAKHFVAYSGPESARHRIDVRPPKRDMYETYFPAFRAAVQKGHVDAVMASYNSVYGTPMSANKPLLQGILRDDWGFNGYVVSDCGAVADIYQHHKAVDTAAQAAALAVKAGTNLNCGTTYAALVKAVHVGLISEKTINKALTKLMTARFRLGMFDPPGQVPWSDLPYSIVESPRHVALARHAAQESMVLLKNKGVLPLSRDVKRIAVIGPTADNIFALLGNYHGTPKHPVTILEGIRNAVPDAHVTYVQGAELVQGFDAGVGTVIDSTYLRPAADSNKHGLKAEYFRNADFKSSPVVTRIDPRVRFFWRDVSPTDSLVANGEMKPTRQLKSWHFAARWSGVLVPPVSGRYELSAAADGGFRLYLDGKLLLDRWDADQPHDKSGAFVNLKAGKTYHIRLEYVRRENNASVRLAWRIPGAKSPLQQAVAAANKADVVIFVGGQTANMEGEEMPVHFPGYDGGDRTSLALPATQKKLLQALQATGKPLVMVLTTGSAMAINWAEQHVPAILLAWYPGEQGGNAVADALFGKINPAGRLPVTFYKSVKQLPPFDDYAMAGRTYRYFKGEPLYPFGYGLSYTHFAYSNLHLSRPKVGPKDKLTISLKVKNTGKRAGDEVVQLYLRAIDSKHMRANKTLRGFKRVTLKPGQEREVSFSVVPATDLRYYNVHEGAYAVEPGTYEVQLGASSADIRLKKRFAVVKD